MFQGEYKRINSDGSYNVYSPGDKVSYQGRIYLYTKASVLTPSEDSDAWEFTGETVPYKSSIPPIKPVEGQIWIDSDKAVTYIYFYDGNSYQWVST